MRPKPSAWMALMLAGAMASPASAASLARRIRKWDVRMKVGDFRQTSYSKQDWDGARAEYLIAEKDDVRLELSRFRIDSPERFVQDRKFQLESQYMAMTSPYPEAISNVQECPLAFQPKKKEVRDGTVYELFAGERYNYGVCAPDLVKYGSRYAIYNCGRKGVFEVRMFSTEKEGKALDPVIGSFSCN